MRPCECVCSVINICIKRKKIPAKFCCNSDRYTNERSEREKKQRNNEVKQPNGLKILGFFSCHQWNFNRNQINEKKRKSNSSELWYNRNWKFIYVANVNWSSESNKLKRSVDILKLRRKLRRHQAAEMLVCTGKSNASAQFIIVNATTTTT